MGRHSQKGMLLQKKNRGNFALTKGHLRGKGAGAQVNRFFRTIRSNKPAEKKKMVHRFFCARCNAVIGDDCPSFKPLVYPRL